MKTIEKNNLRKRWESFRILDNIVFPANTHISWSIGIMHENIIIYNYHVKNPHIHPSPKALH